MECPNCKSNKIRPVTRAWALCLLTGGLISWIPIIGWFFGPILMIAAFFIYFMEKGKRSVQCNECKTRFYISKEEMQKWQAAIHSFKN